MRDFVLESLVPQGTIDESDVELIRRADSVEEALAFIRAGIPEEMAP